MTSLQKDILELREKKALVQMGGGEAAIEKQEAMGKLTARNRILALLDENSFQEYDLFVEHAARGFGMEKKVLPGDGVITGTGTIFGAPVCIYAQDFTPEHYVSRMKLEEVDLASGCAKIRMEVAEKYYYENMSELAGVPIAGEYELIALVKEMSQRKEAYEKVADAMAAVQVKGYGVVGPGLSDIKMEDPVLIKHGNKFGVRIRATSPSIHMIRANIETEIAPIVGSEEQANDLIAYIREGEKSEEGAWETNIFGKSIGELMENGIRGKISMMDDECQMKLQDTMQKIVNDNNGGMVCIIL